MSRTMFVIRTGNGAVFKPKLHEKYLRRYLQLMPGQVAAHDTQRSTIAFFSISGLDVLDGLDFFNDDDKQNVIEWVYRLQILPDELESEESLSRCGFKGSSTFSFLTSTPAMQEFQTGHLAMTYTSLATLAIMGDDFSRVNKKAVIKGVRALQQPDGSFCAILGGSENDMRFVYCAACVCYMLQDWSGMNMELTENFILNSVTYEGGIAQGPGLEAHGGTTYCAVAALSLMGRLEKCLSQEQLENLRRWCVMRQTSGFQGRPNKPTDTCYSFWIGATLKLLGVFDLIDFNENRKYILSTQDILTGGFSKWVDTVPDTLHTYFGICGLALMGEEGLQELHPGLNISQRAADHLHNIHRQWGSP